MTLPEDFQIRWRRLLGREAQELFAALSRPPVTGLRVNSLKIAPASFSTLCPWPLEPVPWCAAGFTLAADCRPGLHPLHRAGVYYLQEPSAMAAAEALSPRADELILDLAAAPGGKATHLVDLTRDRATVIANDPHPGRARALSRNLERWGARRAVITTETPQRLAARLGPVFDRVLLDAPCSGEGMFRKSRQAPAMWSERVVRGCASRQGSLLESAATLVRPGGHLLYSTCTFSPEENEEVIARFLQAHPEFSQLPLALPGASPGRPDWVVRELRTPDLRGAQRFWPHRGPGEGHFMAKLQRRAGEAAPARSFRSEPPPAAVSKLWREFILSVTAADPLPDHRLILRGDTLYAAPENLPDLGGLGVLRPGLLLGKVRKGRFEAGHALAMALTPDSIADKISFAPNDPDLARYLQGHPLERPGPDGWLPVCVSGFPLGWGQRRRGVIRNRYPKGLRA